MYLCPECVLLGFCRKLQAQIVSDEQLANPAYVTDLKAYAHARRISCDGWLPFLLGAYRDYLGNIVDAKGRPLWLDTSVFDGPDIRYWFRDFCKPVPPGVTPRIRREAKERVRVMATILRAVDPVGTLLWGVRAANDAPPPAIRLSRPVETSCPVLAAFDLPAAERVSNRVTKINLK